MYQEEYDNKEAIERGGDDVYSKPVRAGKRTYFFDVKVTKNNDYYLTITESKRRVESDGHFSYDKHKIFLYKEDFEKFAGGLEEVVNFIKSKCVVTERVYDPEMAEKQREARAAASAVAPSSAEKDFSDVDFDKL